MSSVSSTPTKVVGQWGGRREGGGAKPLTDVQRLERQIRRQGLEVEGPVSDPVEVMSRLIGLSPRVAGLRPDLVALLGRRSVVSPVRHLERFLETHCRYTQIGELDPKRPVALGDPFQLVRHEREFLGEALECDDTGRRVYKRAGLIIGRKNRKSTLAAALSLYFGSPADGEHRPVVVQAAGVRDQAAKLYVTARGFIDDPLYGSERLQRLFVAQTSEISCPSIGGKIHRVAGDGDNNHSLDPHLVICDELHSWKTPKQRENWKALTTAGGGRRDPFILFITTEGDGDANELSEMMERVEESSDTDVEGRRPGLTVFRNRAAGLLVYRYAAPSEVDRVKTTTRDVRLIKLANPAPWRTIARLREDLADPMVDESTKLRLYGNIRGEGPGRWISDDSWDECRLPGSDPDDPGVIPQGSVVAVGVDAARTRDTTAVSWVWDRGPELGLVVRVRVWSCKQHKPHHVYVPGRLDNDLARDWIREELIGKCGYQISGVFYDPRFFDDQADELSDEDDLVTVELTQSDEPMRDAWNDFHRRIFEGRVPTVWHDGDPVLRQHVRNAVGIRASRGWIVRKADDERPIDGLAAVVMGCYGASVEPEPEPEPWSELWE